VAGGTGDARPGDKGERDRLAEDADDADEDLDADERDDLFLLLLRTGRRGGTPAAAAVVAEGCAAGCCEI
jgi:hypothetical protein